MVCACCVARARVLASSKVPLASSAFMDQVILLHLLHQRLHRRLLFFPDRLDLGLLIGGQIELSVKMSMWWNSRPGPPCPCIP